MREMTLHDRLPTRHERRQEDSGVQACDIVRDLLGLSGPDPGIGDDHEQSHCVEFNHFGELLHGIPELCCPILPSLMNS